MEKSSCPVCSSNYITIFLEREQVPVFQNIITKDIHNAVDLQKGKLKIAYCNNCGFVFNVAFDMYKVNYGQDYDNTQSHSKFFDDYITKLAEYLVFEKGISNHRIVEVGCGKGLFLRKLVEMSTGNIGFGFDPTYVGSTNALNNRLHFDKSYYGPQCSDIHADIIVSRHVIEHIAYPLDFINTIKKTIEKSRHAKVFIETPDVEWILRNKVIWDFMYEHCSYFSAESLTTAFQIEGFEVENMKHLFNDQYLWMEVSLPSPKKKQNIVTNPGNVPQLSKIFSESEDKLKKFWKYKIENLASKGKVALWGAAGKGVTFANLIDPNKDFISCVVDVNSNKQGSYLPGTGHPIISPELLSSNKIDFAILLNPNYYDEIYNLLRTLNVNVELIDLMDENVIN